MTPQEMFRMCPGLVKVTIPNLEEAFFNITKGGTLNHNETLTNQGLDELDAVEFIMEVEKLSGININDDIGWLLMDGQINTKDFSMIIIEHREKRLELLDI